MIGATFKPPVPKDWTDFPRPHAKAVPPPAPDLARDIMTGTAPRECLLPPGLSLLVGWWVGWSCCAMSAAQLVS